MVICELFDTVRLQRKLMHVMQHNAVGDEFHYVFECCDFDSERDMYDAKQHQTFINRRNANCTCIFKSV